MKLAQSREFLLKEKLFSIRDQVDVFSEYEEPIGYFESVPLQFRKRFWLRELDGEGLLAVVQRMKLTTTFDMYEAYPDQAPEKNRYIGQLSQKWGIRRRYLFTSDDGSFDFEIKGNFWDMEFEILSKGKAIARISKNFWTYRDSYGLKIFEQITDLEAMIILTCVIVLHWDKEQEEHN